MSNKHLFELGQLVATPGALEALVKAEQSAATFVHKHLTGDWSEMDEEDQQANQLAVKEGTRIFSSYSLSTGQKLWIITEWDRSVTTILLPSEY